MSANVVWATVISKLQSLMITLICIMATLTKEANSLVSDIHDRMPVILRPED